ncbi:DUF4276 family protein [Myxococcus sp. SDU36]|uniref:DUF4276 family protein n=1 Tax=Myxococcus sp. SDU36 TaxID=2831967 RepID=UPI00254335AA|nr:DUF4276 family protein [Myxococcus sp. SDU36]WIG95744.1 DUF4276 family protein [Myxococcus sp. SDU36]
MSSIAIYIEGGGDSEAGKAALRQGFDALLAEQKNAARVRHMRWKTVLCGGRGATFDAFLNATTKCTSDIVVLLVDAEGAVAKSTPAGRVEHLANRDNWTFNGLNAERVHLMTQCMEAWLVADPKTLAEFYGKDFREKALPKRTVLDGEPKTSVYNALEAATKDTQKGGYGKIKHASELLKRLQTNTLATRCTSFKHFIDHLNSSIASA